MSSALEGGCACAAIRYRLEEAPFECGYCHCRMCQQMSSAPAMAFASVLKGTPKTRRSSDHGERSFCGDGGTPLAMRVDEEPGFSSTSRS